eukprot:Hpha_TRINITY_DN15424_c4_g3::TRINITY_DN15424_c4_g3_i3::g.173170::m.173170
MAAADGDSSDVDSAPCSHSGESPRPPDPGPAGSPRKVWPGTWNLGKDDEAVEQSEDYWEVRDGRKHLRKVVTRAGVTFDYLEMLGRGAQGYVFKMKHRQSQRVVAVKCFSKRRLLEEQERNCLRNPAIWHEFQLLKRVGDHPGIVEVEKLVLETEHYFYVPMEYVDGIDLHHLLWPRDRKHTKPPIDSRILFRHVMEALSHCHEKGVAHRDLKPSNILITKDASGTASYKLKAKMMDFGLGAEVPKNPDGSPMQMRRPVGTTAWCAPEVLNVFGELMRSEKSGGGGGMGPAGRAGTMWQVEKGLGYYARPADIWSSGVLLWEMMTLNHLFHRPLIEPRQQGATENRLVRSWKAMPDSLEKDQKPHFEALPQGCKELLIKMLNPEPSERPTAIEILKHPWLQG